MKVTMRLYKRHDLDLLYLYNTPGFPFQKNLKKVICDYVRSGGVISEDKKIVPPENYKNVTSRLTQLHINLSEEEDSDVINWLNQFSNGYKNSLLKNIYRGYLSYPVLGPYYKDNNTNKHNNLSVAANIPNKSIEPVNINAKSILEEILNTELSEQNTDVVLKKGDEVLKENPGENEEREESSGDELDIFDEFENMMKKF